MSDRGFLSIFNDVLGPVMRGPSSSHTAGSYHIARTARNLLGEEPVSAVCTFDPAGSYAKTYSQQNADKAFAAGFLGWELTDDRFERAHKSAAEQGLRLSFEISPLASSDHPNMVYIRMRGRTGRELRLVARSTGGGSFIISRVDDIPVEIDGKSGVAVRIKDGRRWRTLSSDPVFLKRDGKPIFQSAAGMTDFARRRRLTLGQAGLRYEAGLLGLSEEAARAEMARRYDIMAGSVAKGLRDDNVHMKILEPSAGRIMKFEKAGRLAAGGIHTRAAARALAVMHVGNSGGVVCAAPTGGSAGVIPGVLVTLAETRGLSLKRIVSALFAAGAVGLIVAKRATFAAEVAGCQVEIGAAGAMAAAAVVEAAGGNAIQAAAAAAIALQNTMGSVCDLVQGLCEIPCHTRNAAAAAAAFVCADLILGGYRNPIPLDETIDAAFSSGRLLPAELRCTALGGLAATPSARALPLKHRSFERARL